MALYRLEVFGVRDLLVYRRHIRADDDGEAVQNADAFYDACVSSIQLEGFTLFEGGRLVHRRARAKLNGRPSI